MQTTRTPYSISFMATVLLLLLFACHSTVANAAVALGATRVIYPANQKQVLLPVTNNDPASVICRVKNGERVNLIALTPDGKRSSRRMDRLKVVIYPMADRSLVTYFPESNHMLTLDNHDPLSGIPGYKSIPVELEPSN